MDDFSGLEYDQESITDEDVITKTNNLLNQFNLPTQVTSISDITASLFVVLYESLFSDRLSGIIRQPVTREDEIHNCQTVIDILSVDVIKDNLSHIRGLDIVDGKVQAISNLIDIFTFLFEYVIKQIESDVPSDTEDDYRSVEQQDNADDLDTLSPDPVSRTLEKERGDWMRTRSGKTSSVASRVGQSPAAPRGPKQGALSKAATWNGQQPIAAARTRQVPVTSSTEAPLPVHPDISSHAKDGTPGFVDELVRESEVLEKKMLDQRTQPVAKAARQGERDRESPAGDFSFIGVRPASTQPSAAVAHTTTPQASTHLRSDASTVNSGNAFLTSTAPVMSSVVPKAVTDADTIPLHRLAHPSSSENASNFSTTLPAGRDRRRPSAHMNNKLRATVGPIHYHSRLTPEKPYHNSEEPVKGLSSSYGDLHQMVQRTAVMTRAALHTSPMRMRRDPSTVLDITDLSSGDRYQVPPSEAMKLAQDLNLGPEGKTCQDPYSVGDANHFSASRMQRKVEFSHDGSGSTVEPSVRKDARNPARSHTCIHRKNVSPGHRGPAEVHYPRAQTDFAHSQPTTKYGWETRRYLSDSPTRQQLPFRGQHERLKSEGGCWSDSEAERDSYAHKLKQRYREVVDDVLSTGSDTDDMAAVCRRWAASKEHKAKLSQRLDQMGKAGLADAQRHLEAENVAFQRKQDFLKKMYKEEYGDVEEEVKSQIDKEHNILRNMDEEYQKLLHAAAAAAANRPVAKKAKSATKPRGKVKRPQPTVGSKVRRRSSSTGQVPEPRERPLSLADDDDLMPILLEEFPHLYMSEHTWHELWRRGIAQIENLTRAYEESKRKKSKAQQQVEEAARKHEVLASIVKKQLEHNKRMRDIHDQKKQQAMLKNKLHEKRVQSARARRYYNEYQVRARSKMLKRRNREEMIFKNLFKDGLAIQKERIRDLRRYAKEQRDKQAQKRQDEIDSLENFYKDQFEMLVERITKDREEMLIREHAQQKVLDKMKKDLRHKMEKEIVDIQSQLFRDEDDTYFRQLDADRLRHQLHLAKYQTRI